MKNHPVRLKEILNFVLDNAHKKSNAIDNEIAEYWEDISGDIFKNKTHVISFKNGVLKVKVFNSSYLYKLTLIKNKLLKDLNQKVKQKVVRDISFII